RIISLDVTRGLSIVFIILLHYALPWFHKNSVFIAGCGQLFLEFFGPSMFIILSTISVVLNIKQKKDVWSEKDIRNNNLMRGFAIIIIGFIYNSFSMHLWVWNILMFIGFGQIFTYYALKLNKIVRIIVGIMILLPSEFIREFFWVFRIDNPLFMIINFFL
ncbi:MAG: heparan-alpha-glucosaminide N-acetyltransferase domain-containing protein, partial [Promethearchaeota archaeon]